MIGVHRKELWVRKLVPVIVEVMLANWRRSSSLELRTHEVKGVLTSLLKQESRVPSEGGLAAFSLYLISLQLTEWSSPILEQYALLKDQFKA